MCLESVFMYNKQYNIIKEANSVLKKLCNLLTSFALRQ